MQLVWYSLALSAMNTYCIQELARREKQLTLQQIFSCLLFFSAHCLKESTTNTHAELTAGMAKQHRMSSSAFCKTLVTESIHKRGGKPPSLMRFPFLHPPQGLYSLTVRAQGTSSTRAHFIKCHFGPNFTL